MTSAGSPTLTSAQLEKLEAAHILLRQSRATEAVSLARQVAYGAPSSVEAWQLWPCVWPTQAT